MADETPGSPLPHEVYRKAGMTARRLFPELGSIYKPEADSLRQEYKDHLTKEPGWSEPGAWGLRVNLRWQRLFDGEWQNLIRIFGVEEELGNLGEGAASRLREQLGLNFAMVEIKTVLASEKLTSDNFSRAILYLTDFLFKYEAFVREAGIDTTLSAEDFLKRWLSGE
jgi:hypothetical protein